MPYDISTNSFTDTPELIRLKAEKKAGIELQKRKHLDWDDNYELYRNRVRTNRLTQRQAVNIPLMKETVKTLLSKIDDAPEIEWKELGGDEVKELIFQEIWNQQVKDGNMELVDILDKKNVLLYGISTKKLNIDDDGVCVDVLDVYDIVLDPLMKQWDLESARFIIQQNIFKSVREILADPKYTAAGKQDLKMWADSVPGMTQSQVNKDEWEKKMRRLEAMGVGSKDFAYFAGGERVINLTEHYTQTWNGKEFEKRVIVYADDTIELYNELLTDCIGVDFWPFVIWAEDPETVDVYPDSVADLIRTPNKVLNVWFSQMIENRTLKNFQMHWFLPGQNYTPQTYTPGPGVMLPAPPGDDINKVIKPVEISGLDDTLEAINAIVAIAERGSGATALEKGESQPGVQTLGEIQVMVGKANERTTAMAKFYRLAWYELAVKWNKLMQANAPKLIKLHKTSGQGKIYPKRVFKNDWVSKDGYEPTVRSSSEREIANTKTIQKFIFVKTQSPNNMALQRIALKRMVDILDLTPEEMKEVEDGEKQAQEQMQNAAAAGAPAPAAPAQGPAPAPAPAGQPQPQPGQNDQVMSQIAQHLANLG